MDNNDGKMVIAILGAPHSGKSVFVAELYRQMLADPAIGSRKVFLQRACPDGEGMWSAESDQDLVKEIRRKGSFTPEVVNFFLSSLDGLRKSKDIVLADCGGLKSLENILILGHSTDSIILSSSPEKMQQWELFCQNLDAIIDAIKTGDTDRLYEMQMQRMIEVVPEGKMTNYPTDEDLKAEITKRLQILKENFESQVEKLDPHKIGVIAELGSRLLTPEQRTSVDEAVSAGESLPAECLSSLDTPSTPWRGEMLDLDRDRGGKTYSGAISEVTTGLGEMSTERLQEVAAETRPVDPGFGLRI